MSSRPRRRNRISTADARVVAVVAAASGIVAAFADAHPTEIGAVDVGLAVALAAFTTWIAASSPWWALAAVGVVAVLCAANPVLLAAGLAATACALAVGWRRASWPAVRALSAAASVQVILRCEIDAFHGESALLAAGVFRLDHPHWPTSTVPGRPPPRATRRSPCRWLHARSSRLAGDRQRRGRGPNRRRRTRSTGGDQRAARGRRSCRG